MDSVFSEQACCLFPFLCFPIDSYHLLGFRALVTATELPLCSWNSFPPDDGSVEMFSHLLVPQAKFKSLTVVSTFKLETENGSVLQLTEASSGSEVGPELWK